MGLSEPQILRYSRQILLKEIGGVGQSRLLGAAVAIDAEGPAFVTAGAYLAAGGSPVRARFALEGFDPELDPAAPVRVALGDRGTKRSAGAEVAVGSAEGSPRVVFRGQQGCAECLAEARGALGPAPEGVDATVAGTLAALVCQRLILGALDGVGALWVERGRVTEAPLPTCSHR